MKTHTLKSIIVLSLICFPNMIFSQTDFYGGNVSGVWTLEGSPYRIFDHVTIPDDSTLNIEGGVQVEFQGHYAFQVQGNIIASGTASDSIFFTVNDTTGFSNPAINDGGWGGIRIIDINTENDSSIFEYCSFQYGKAFADYWHDNSGGALCIIRFNKVRVSNCLFTHNMASGTEVPSGGAIHLAWSDIKIQMNKFEHNEAVSGGAIQMHESDPEFRQNLFANNLAREGGSISVGSLSNPTFYKDSIINNQATEFGGGIMCWDKSVIDFNGVQFHRNSAPWGGGLGLAGIKASFDECTIKENTAVNLGGGIASDFSHVTINNSTIASNSASMSGGIHAWYDTLTVDNCQFNDNRADFGGGLHADFSQLSLSNSTFSENSAVNGGGVHFWNCDLKVSATDFISNLADNEGGAIEANYADTLVFDRPHQLLIEQSNFQGNDAVFRAGAVKFSQPDSDTSFANIRIDKSVFKSNHAERVAGLLIRGKFKDFSITGTKFILNRTDLWNGGASFALGCTGQVINCLFAENHSASGNPGASGASNGSFIHYINCTFANNSASDAGALSVHRDGKASVSNCIFWNNIPKQIAVRGIREGAFSELYVNHSNIQHGKDSIEADSLAALYWGNGNISEEPLFYDANNGDYRLQDESPCIDAGTDSLDINGTCIYAPETDMDMNLRPQEGSTLIDMGAYENQNVLSIPSSMGSDNSWITAYPNPFDHQLNINLRIHEPSLVSIIIYSITGRKVADIIHHTLKPGEHHFYWNPEHVGGGMYIVKCISEHNELSKLILFVH